MFCSRMGNGIPITCTTTYQKWTGQPSTWQVARIPCLQTWGVSKVLTPEFTVIKGFYATGNNVSGISYAAYQDVEGIGLGFSLTSGRLAGAAAAENAGYTVTEDTKELNETGKATMEAAKSSKIEHN